MAWVELSTGRFFAACFPSARLADQLARIAPAEVLIAEGTDLPQPAGKKWIITTRPPWAFALGAATDGLAKHFGTCAGWMVSGFDARRSMARQLPRGRGMIIEYLVETQKSSRRWAISIG